MGRYLMTHSLLASWLYTMKENPYEDMTTERDPMGEFMQTLRREPTLTTEAMQNGIKFEDMVTDIINTAAFPAARRSIWPITRKLAPIRRCDDARHHRSCERPGGAGHWHKGADRSGFGAIRRYPCGVGRGSAANIPANADWRDCQPTGWQEEVRTDWGELLRRFRN